MYPVIQIPDDVSELPEQVGTKFKFWFRDANQILTMFKEGRPGTGENWAEKVCAETAALLCIPHAPYELALWRGRQGVITPNFVPDGDRLVMGNEIVARFVRGYAQTATYKARQHTVSLVGRMMRWWDLPLNYEAPRVIKGALQVFIGYLMLDALAGNQDRHHNNWAVILSRGRSITLAPSFDHASSLGRNENDENRIQRLETKDAGWGMKAYCDRARSALYGTMSDPKPLTTLEAFRTAALLDLPAARYWLSQLQLTTLTQFDDIVSNVPREYMSGAAASFALEMLNLNRLSLLRLSI